VVGHLAADGVGGDQISANNPLAARLDTLQDGDAYEAADDRARKLVACINASSWFPALDEEWPKHCAQAAAMGLELRLIDPELRRLSAPASVVQLAELIDAGAGEVVALIDFRTFDAQLWLSEPTPRTRAKKTAPPKGGRGLTQSQETPRNLLAASTPQQATHGNDEGRTRHNG